MANEEHLAILKQGVAVWNQWRGDNPLVMPDLSNANLGGIYLPHVNLGGANLSSADISLARLNLAYLGYADLRHADLHNTDLRSADLRYADLGYADLYGVILSGTNLNTANLTQAMMGQTILGSVNLSEVVGLKTVRHRRPSSIGTDTITLSQGKIPEVFLKGAGVPDIFIAYMKSLTGTAFDFYSCFISHSSKDKAFAERLHADLQAKGIRTWYAPEDLKIGEVILLGIDKGIQVHDKLLIVLSEHSVVSKWVEHEVEAALYEESRPERKTKVLFPIRLDDTVMDTKVNWAYRIRQRHIGDFTNWKDHDAYQKAFDRLLRDLKQEAQK